MRSTRVTLTFSLAAILVLLVIVSVSAVMGLTTSNRRVEAIHRKWLVVEEQFGDLQYTISDFRIDQNYRLFSSQSSSAAQADFLSSRASDRVENLLQQVGDLSQDARFTDDLGHLIKNWRLMKDYYGSLLQRPASLNLGQVSGYGTAEQRHFDVVHLAAANLIDDAKRAAKTEVDAATRSAWNTTSVVVALATLAGLISIGLMIRVEFQITRPLSTITSALLRLAAGDRTIRVPERDRRDEIGAMAAAFEVFRNNAVALAEAQEQAEALAREDALTGLPNRRFFERELQQTVARSNEGSVFAVMLIDLDRFKPINDLQGHAAGDRVLRLTASRLRKAARSGETVARLGGDEFAIVTALASNPSSAHRCAIELGRRIVATVSEPIDLGAARVSLGASVGIAICPADGTTADDVLRAADMAMYRAKRNGRGAFCFFESGMEAELRAKADLESDLRQALETGEIRPYYQPIVELRSNEIVGFEVLARWPRDEGGSVPPDVFIPVAEQIGVLGQMTQHLVRQALFDTMSWGEDVRIAINVSQRQIQDPAFPVTLASALMETGFAPQRLEIEMTETAVMGDLELAKATLASLRQLGISVVLDDFGSRFSDLSRLCELDIRKVKINCSTLVDTAMSERRLAVLDALVKLVKKLDLTLVGEGIETFGHMEALKSCGCDYGQGFWFSPAVSAIHAEDMLSGRLTPTALSSDTLPLILSRA